MRIFSKIIATGREWKPCIECDRVFKEGEIISSIEHGNGLTVTYWYCHRCIERFFRAYCNFVTDLYKIPQRTPTNNYLLVLNKDGSFSKISEANR